MIGDGAEINGEGIAMLRRHMALHALMALLTVLGAAGAMADASRDTVENSDWREVEYIGDTDWIKYVGNRTAAPNVTTPRGNWTPAPSRSCADPSPNTRSGRALLRMACMGTQ